MSGIRRRIKTAKGGVWQRLLDALNSDIGKIVTNEELIRVSGQHNYARRIRELRAEGWDIVYIKSPPGYVLKSVEKIEKNVDAYINLKLRQKILERDRVTCQLCGHKGGDSYSDGETVKLEVDHIVPLIQGGKTVEENLWVFCSRCNAGKKSLFSYPETAKNKIVTLNLPDDLRRKITAAALKRGLTVNSLLLHLIEFGIKEFD